MEDVFTIIRLLYHDYLEYIRFLIKNVLVLNFPK